MQYVFCHQAPLNRHQATFSVFFTLALAHASFLATKHTFFHCDCFVSSINSVSPTVRTSKRNSSHPWRKIENAAAKTKWTKKKEETYRFYLYSSKKQKKSCYCEFCFILYLYTDHKYDRPTTGEHVFVDLFCSGIGLVCTVRWCTVIGLRSR